MRLLTLIVPLALIGCPDPTTGGDATDIASDPAEPPWFTNAGCAARYERVNPQSGTHTDVDASIRWQTNPPSSGDHFGIWARWGVHNEIVPRGIWVHNLEHGGVAVLYRCAGDCTAVRTQLENFVRMLPTEPACSADDAGIRRRIVLTQDPLIDSPIAAAGWGSTYHAECFDRPSLEAFVLHATGRGPEDFCSEGFYP